MASSPSMEKEGSSNSPSMQEFKLYQTQSNFYMIGGDKSKMFWRVLKIDRLNPSELDIHEDPTIYTKRDCSELLRRIHEGNKATAGLKFVTHCYGIVGFVKFLGPYYMLLITERRSIGTICGHNVYAVTKSSMIPLPNSSLWSTMTNLTEESRYRKLLNMVDLTKDFYFSYSYHVMRSLQNNLCDSKNDQDLYETMFVWNGFLTRRIRDHLQNTLWTVALVYGFFKQEKISLAGRDLMLTLIARRSCYNAGTRYMKRGVDENGKVANDVETEQIVFEDVPDGYPVQISSVVQNRGSIPLFWSQETSRLNLKPDIILSKKDQNYEATRLHFENLAERYGNPIIILNLIKTREKKPRESILRAEFVNAIDLINKDSSEETRLRFLHWDLKLFQSKGANVLVLLGKVAMSALVLTGFLYCQVTSDLKTENFSDSSLPERNDSVNSYCQSHFDIDEEDVDSLKRSLCGTSRFTNGNCSSKPPRIQKGVLRTNCIDCLDRTNVAQYAYGLAAFGQQLQALGVRDTPKIDLDDPLADILMWIYERMGDTLSHQYGGSAAHKKVFSERRGQWKAATQSQELFRTLQRYYSNAYVDPEKQDAINVFLGNFQPQQGKPAVWELRSNIYRFWQNVETNMQENERSFMKRCFSDGNVFSKRTSDLSTPNIKDENHSNNFFPERLPKGTHIISESSPDIPTSESDIAFSRYTPQVPRRQILGKDFVAEYGNVFGFSNFLDMDQLSSSGSIIDEDQYDRSSIVTSSSFAGSSSENVVNGLMGESTPSSSGYGSYSMKFCQEREQTATELPSGNLQNGHILEEFSDSFVQWVTHGDTLGH